MSEQVQAGIIIYPDSTNLELIAGAWLDAKSKRSGSQRTAQAYKDTLLQFRAMLQNRGLDLDSDPRTVALVAQAYAGMSTVNREVAPATFNLRLAIISSFYSFANKRGLLQANPIAFVDRRPVQSYAHAVAIDAATIRARLAAIDRRSLLGQRDYSLLSVALITGRRSAELAGLTIGDIEHTSAGLLLTFRRCKGGKVMQDLLPLQIAAGLLAYLQSRIGQSGPLDQGAPVWTRHDRAASEPARPLSARAIADICERRIGTSKVHALRHSFAKQMETAGAKVSDIQARLGHSSLQTTGRYLQALARAENPHAALLVQAMGLE